MNSNRKVFLFVCVAVVIYLLASLAALVFDFKWAPFQRINLIADVIGKTSKDSVAIVPDSAIIVIENKPNEDFNLYHKSHSITNFSTDTSSPSLEQFVKKIHELKSGKKKKIRIAYFGDSMIEGDLLTQTLRSLLQKELGGSGVGFVPVTSQVSQFRQTVNANYSNGWQDENFKSKSNSKLFFSGHLFRSSGDWVYMTDQTIVDTIAPIEKSLLCGQAASPVNAVVNNQNFPVQAPDLFNRVVIDKNLNHGVRVAISNETLPVYGISFESDSGIFVDNFSFRGITGIEFNQIDSSFLTAIAKNNPYDLIIFQYGVNLLFRPNDKNFSWYAKTLSPVIRKFKNCFPQTDFIVVSTADRAFRYAGEYKSAVGIDSLIKVQALLAFESGSSFYNQFETMGGTNSIVEWASMKPPLANKDYVHPNHRGAEVLGKYFFEAIMNDYHKYVKKL